eukprot:COSAG06_NODE_2368_length_6998_cov_3.945934_6_plen_176_part_00
MQTAILIGTSSWVGTTRSKEEAVRKRPLEKPFHATSDHFTKPGSGQTSVKLTKEAFFAGGAGVDPQEHAVFPMRRSGSQPIAIEGAEDDDVPGPPLLTGVGGSGEGESDVLLQQQLPTIVSGNTPNEELTPSAHADEPLICLPAKAPAGASVDSATSSGPPNQQVQKRLFCASPY